MVTRAAPGLGLTGGLAPLGGGSAASRIYDLLRQRIIELDLAPNTVLSRNELAREYGVSQTPIRDAIQRLEQDGLVRIMPQSRTFVTPINIPRIYEAHFLRRALEAEVVRVLARQDGERDLGRARSVLRMQEAIADDPDQLGVFQELDSMFHEALFVAIGRGALYRFVRSYSGHLDRARRLLLASEKDKVARILAGHHAILDAIDRRDPQAAEEAMWDHLSQTTAKVEELRKTHSALVE